MSAPTGPTGFPLWPLLATMAMQALATMAAYSVPALAPVVAADLGVDGALVGYFVSVVYGVGILSSLSAASAIHRFGAVRVGQAVLLAALALVLICAQGSVPALAAGAVALGVAYGATAPVSTHLLVPRTPPGIINLVLSIRQIGVPLGGVAAATLLPPLALALGWQRALLLEALPIVIVLLLLEGPRRRWDRIVARRPGGARGGLGESLELLRHSPALRSLSFAGFIYSGVQLVFVAFMTVHLTSRAGLDLVSAGWALATYQLSGIVTRPIWGWLADRYCPARWLLVGQGFVMAVAALLAGHFSAAWATPAILLVAALAGATASGYTGIAYAEFARLGGERRTEATGLGSATMFAGVVLLPSLGSVLVTVQDSYVVAYGVMAALAGLAATVLAWPQRNGA